MGGCGTVCNQGTEGGTRVVRTVVRGWYAKKVLWDGDGGERSYGGLIIIKSRTHRCDHGDVIDVVEPGRVDALCCPVLKGHFCRLESQSE